MTESPVGICPRPITVTTEEPAVPSTARAVNEAPTPETSDEETIDAQKERVDDCRQMDVSKDLDLDLDLLHSF